MKILIAGYYGLNNIGDEAILAGMINSLSRYFVDVEYYVLTNNPEITYRLHGVNTVKQSFTSGIKKFTVKIITDREPLYLLRAIKECDIFILGGGSLLQDLKPYYLPSIYSLLSYAQKKEKITVIYGIGAGPIDTNIGKKITQRVLNKTNLVTVRDDMSKNVLDVCGVKEVIKTIDPAFGLEKNKFNLMENVRFDDGSYFSVTNYNWLCDSDKYKNPTSSNSDTISRRTTLASLYNDIAEKYAKNIAFVPTVKTDIFGYNYLQNQSVSLNNKSSVLEYRNEFNYILSALNGSELLIGMRLHSMIISTILGVPFVPISYCGKVKSYLEEVQMEEFYLDVEELETKTFQEQLFSNIESIYNSKSTYSNKLKDFAEKFQSIAFKNAEMVYNLTVDGAK